MTDIGKVASISLLISIVLGLGVWALVTYLPYAGLMLRSTPIAAMLTGTLIAFLVFQISFAVAGGRILGKSDLSKVARRIVMSLGITTVLFLDGLLILFALVMALSHLDETGESTITSDGRLIIEVNEGFMDPYYSYYEAYGPLTRSDVRLYSEDHILNQGQQGGEGVGTGGNPASDPPAEQGAQSDITDDLDAFDDHPTGEPYYSAFIDSTFGFRMYSSASGSTLQRTPDAGTTWETVGYPSVGEDDACRFIHSIELLEDGGLAATVGYPEWVEATTTVISHSSDGGLTWAPL